MPTNNMLNNSLLGQSGDGAFAGSNSPSFTGTVDVNGELQVDNLNLDGDTISSSSDINLVPGGANNVLVPLVPAVNNAAASKAYVDAASGNPAGVSGNIQWNNSGVFGGDPNFNTDGAGNITIAGSFGIDNLFFDGNRISATSGEVELEDAMLFNPLNANNQLIQNVPAPVAGTDAVNKDYVDQTALNGTSVYAATTTNLTVTQSGAGVGATLTNAGAQAVFSIDGVSPPLGSNVLVKNLANAANEGIYTVTNAGSVSTNWVLTRATSYDTAIEINNTGLIVVRNGTTLAGTAWYNTATIVTVDTTNFNYVTFGLTLPVSVPMGGTGRTTLNAYQLLAGGTTTTGAVQSVNAGSNGQLLQSKGNAALPDFTTATYPTTATTAGQMLRADGTNWVASTATYPNTVTANNILYASGTNTVGQLTPGTGVIAALGQNVSGSGGMALTNNPTFVGPTLGVALATSLGFGSTALDTFEIGTFTPTITATTPGNLAVTYGSRQGSYMRINNYVFFSGICVASNITYTTASGTIRMGGFPYAAGSSSDNTFQFGLAGGNAFTPPGSTICYCGNMSNGLTSMGLLRSGTNSGTVAAVQISSFATANGLVLNFQGYYII